MELDSVGHRPSARKRRRVRERRVRQVQQVLHQQTVLHGHVDKDLCVHHVPLGRPREARQLRRRLAVARPRPHKTVLLAHRQRAHADVAAEHGAGH
eukprot:355362-Chlamydomonas_euryale.AAC.4